MLDHELKAQLIEVLKPLNKEIEILYSPSTHNSQAELLEMLREVQSLHPKLILKENSNSSEQPFFSLALRGEKARLHFRGIPGGHEFTSFRPRPPQPWRIRQTPRHRND